jgi:hypothetical protein
MTLFACLFACLLVSGAALGVQAVNQAYERLTGKRP